MTLPAKTKTKQAIVNAASRVVFQSGAGHLTLDAVAKEAGVSKGGLLYHFPNKESLVAGLIEGHLEAFERAVEQHLATEQGPGCWLRAFIHASFDEDAAVPLETNAGLLAAVAHNPALLEPVRERTAAWRRRAEADGLSHERATLIRMAVDGLAFNDLFGLDTPQAAGRAALKEALLALTHEEPR